MLVCKTRLNLVYFDSGAFKCLDGISYCFYSKKSFKIEKKRNATHFGVLHSPLMKKLL